MKKVSVRPRPPYHSRLASRRVAPNTICQLEVAKSRKMSYAINGTLLIGKPPLNVPFAVRLIIWIECGHGSDRHIDALGSVARRALIRDGGGDARPVLGVKNLHGTTTVGPVGVHGSLERDDLCRVGVCLSTSSSVAILQIEGADARELYT